MTGASHWMTMKLGRPMAAGDSDQAAEKGLGGEVDQSAAGEEAGGDSQDTSSTRRANDRAGDGLQILDAFVALRGKPGQHDQIGDIEDDQDDGIIEM